MCVSRDSARIRMVMNGWARMKTTQKIAAITLIVLLGAVAYGFLRTGQPANTTAPKGAKGLQTALVDQSPMRTAQKLARLADTPDEQALGDRLEEVKAQLESDEDEVDDATQDLIQAGGDAKGHAEQIGQEHDALSHEVDTAVPSYPSPLPDQFGLVHLYRQWSALRQKREMLEQAKQTVLSAAAGLAAMHDALDKRIDAAKEASPDLAVHSKKAAAGAPAASRKERSHEESAAALAKMKEIVLDQKDLTNFDKRADYEKRRAAVYAQWSDLVAARQRDVLHRSLLGALIVLGIVLIGFF